MLPIYNAIFPVTNRKARNHSVTPPAYPGATYTYLKGTGVNSTHWTLNARCEGCTRWTVSNSLTTVDTGNSAFLAYAYAENGAVSNPSSNTSNFPVHQVQGTYTSDLTLAKSAQTVYQGWIKSNLMT